MPVSAATPCRPRCSLARTATSYMASSKSADKDRFELHAGGREALSAFDRSTGALRENSGQWRVVLSLIWYSPRLNDFVRLAL